MKRQKNFFLLLMVFLQVQVAGQNLQPGFDPREYMDVLAITFGKFDSLRSAQGRAAEYKRDYQSPVVGLDNQWSLWMRNDNRQAVITIRGTVASTASWLANAYAIMQPATGTFQVADSFRFRYRVAADSSAAVHTGWLISLASIAADIEAHIKNGHAAGVRNFILTGHSQGAGICFLLRSYLHYRTLEGALPADVTYKTYCSAAPKPGNLYYAYDFEFINRGGWAFTVVNAADWVPETPVTVQQFTDLNYLNPFRDIGSMLRNQSLAVRVYAGMVYRKLNGSTSKAARRQQRYLGKRVGKEVVKKLPALAGLQKIPTQHYVRAGHAVVLRPDSGYYHRFPNDPGRRRAVWTHHGFDAYVWLLRKVYGE